MTVSVPDAAQEGTGGMHGPVQDLLEMYLLWTASSSFVLLLGCLWELAGSSTSFNRTEHGVHGAGLF